jgi:Xaa-Pro aminopeptidase
MATDRRRSVSAPARRAAREARRIRPDEIDLERPFQPDLDPRQLAALRRGRLERLQATMRSRGTAICLLFSPANIRYATGTDVMGVWSATTFARHALVPADGEPVLFEYPGSMHVSERLVGDVRPAREWQFKVPSAEGPARAWAREIGAVMAELGLAGERLAVDKLDVPGFLALGAEGVEVADAGPVTLEAREVKTEEELGVVRLNGTIGDEMLAELEAAIRPGVREYELLAALSHALLRRHGEFLSTRLLASGDRTNPWMHEAHGRVVRAGEMVALDTDAHGYEGYVIDVSRGFLCGDGPPDREQRDAYGAAFEVVQGMADAVRPGMTFWELANAAPELDERYREQRYASLGHQAGLEIEGPDIPYPDEADSWTPELAERTLRPGMVLSLQCYAGAVGGSAGVKLEDQVIVTDHGCELMCRYPYDERLLA